MVPFDPVLLRDRHNIWLEAEFEKSFEDIVGLENEDRFPYLIERFGTIVQSPNARVTGSLWIKRYGSLVAGALYAWIHHSYGMDVSLKDVRVIISEDGIKFHVRNCRLLENLDSAGSDEQRTDLYIQHLFAVNVLPVIQMTVRHTRIPEKNLWATLSYTLAYWKAEWLRQAPTSDVRRRIEEIYRRMEPDASAGLFAGIAGKPLLCSFRSVEDPLHEERRILIRDKCCLNYCLPGEDRYCYTCPLISDERRIEKYLAVH